MKKKILTGAMSGRNVSENKAGLNLKKRRLVRTAARVILQQKNLVMTNIAESKTDERPATIELTGFPLRVKEILAPTDLTKDSRKGLRYATALAKHLNAKVVPAK